MLNENEQPAYPWDDDEESGLASDASYEEDLPRQPQARTDDFRSNVPGRRPEPVRRPRPRGVPGSADFYEETESDEPQRPRRVRQSREEVEARLRQRYRQQGYTREQGEARSRSSAQPRSQAPRPQRPTRETSYDYPREAVRQPRPTRDFTTNSAPRPTRNFAAENPMPRTPEPYDDHEGYNEGEERYPNEHRHHRHHHRRERRGGAFSTVLTGCIGGVITLLVVAAVLAFFILHNTPVGQNLGVTKSTISQPPQTQTLALANATQIIVKNQVGNISVNIDQNATSAMLTSVKHVQATSQSDANNQFKGIVLSTQTLAKGADPACLANACLLISATVPANTSGGGLFGAGNSDSIDLTITLPPDFNSPDPTSPNIITASDDAGNINVSGFNGVLNLNGNAGNISIAHALIYASTCIQTLHGNIAIAQQSIFDLATASSRVPCSNTTSTDSNHPWFSVKSGVGNVDITLTTNLNNLLLDANTNNGTITDDFQLALTNSDGSYSYHGPIVPNTNPTASLYVATSTGNIALHKG